MKKAKSTFKELTKNAARIKVVKSSRGLENAPFFIEKMERGAKILAVAGLPKLK